MFVKRIGRTEKKKKKKKNDDDAGLQEVGEPACFKYDAQPGGRPHREKAYKR